MKKIILLLFLLVLSLNAQTLTQLPSSGSMPYTAYSGWINFQKVGSTWTTKMYTLDSNKFQIISNDYSMTPQYTYTFDAYEKLAGSTIYSLGVDLTGDGIPEFYVMAYNGTSTVYYSSFKIFDITTGKVIMEKKDPAAFYTYPSIADVNNDGQYELYFAKYPYPALTTYVYEIYSTGLSSSVAAERPAVFSLKQNYPNPFNPSTVIEYSIDTHSNVAIDIYDIRGTLLRTLVNAEKAPGSYTEVWDGRNSSGQHLSSGVYFYKFRGADNISPKKMVMLR